ncbi:MAG: PKD domain-containing protein [Candidatus Bathyarchaeia archaeon]
MDKDGRFEPEEGETDPFNSEDDPYIPPPVAFFDYSSEKPWVNETVTFNASASYSEKGSITSYEWNFDDGNKTLTLELTINHVYNNPGKYNVTLKVADNNTLWNTTTKTITVYHRTDLNKDGAVNIVDLSIAAIAYQTKPEYPKWNATADINKDEIINILDLSIIAKDYGKTI